MALKMGMAIAMKMEMAMAMKLEMAMAVKTEMAMTMLIVMVMVMSQHIYRKAKQWGVGVEVVSQMRFNIPKMYKFHKSQSRDIDVDFLRFEIPRT